MADTLQVKIDALVLDAMEKSLKPLCDWLEQEKDVIVTPDEILSALSPVKKASPKKRKSKGVAKETAVKENGKSSSPKESVVKNSKAPKSVEEPKPSSGCTWVKKSGPNKGNPCGNPPTKDSEYCSKCKRSATSSKGKKDTGFTPIEEDTLIVTEIGTAEDGTSLVKGDDDVVYKDLGDTHPIVGMYVNGKVRPLTDEEKEKHISEGFLVE